MRYLIMAASISTDFLAIIALCFTIGLAKRYIIFNDYKNSIYIALSVTTIILLLLEIATVFMEYSSNNIMVVPNRIANMMGFALCPVVPVLLLLLNDKLKEKCFYKSILAFPLYLNAFICILSLKTGWIFSVDSHNQYVRGELFLLPTLFSIFYIILLLIELFKNKIEYEKDDAKILILIFIVPILGTIIQILFENVLLIWISTAISLLLYYIFLRELQFKYDIQTGIRNRRAFENEMDKYLKDNRNAVIVIADLNNLKSINDKYGHKAGDDLIKYAAKILEESFLGIGKTFRIGGDEFCVICREIQQEALEKALTTLYHTLNTTNQKLDIEIILAYGYAFYNKQESENIYTAFNQADKAMYVHKAELKGC